MVKAYTTNSTKKVTGPGLVSGIVIFVLAGLILAGGVLLLRKNSQPK
jgi:hypothetical protein